MASLLFGKEKCVANVPENIDTLAYAKTMNVDVEAEPGLYEFLCQALNHPLPEPWTEHADKKGRVFYWNPMSSHSSWQHPLASTHKALIASYRRVMAAPDREAAVVAEIDAFHRKGEEELGQWRESVAEDGTPYYYKVNTQLTRWDNPRDSLLSHMELRVRMLSQLVDRSEEDPTLLAATGGDSLAEPVSPILALGNASSPVKAIAPLGDARGPSALTDAGAISPKREHDAAQMLASMSPTSSYQPLLGTVHSMNSLDSRAVQAGDLVRGASQHGGSMSTAPSAATMHTMGSMDSLNANAGDLQGQQRLGQTGGSMSSSPRVAGQPGQSVQGSRAQTPVHAPGAERGLMLGSMAGDTQTSMNAFGSSGRGLAGRQTPTDGAAPDLAMTQDSQQMQSSMGSPAGSPSSRSRASPQHSTRGGASSSSRPGSNTTASRKNKHGFGRGDVVQIPGSHTAEETRVVQKAVAEANAAAVAEGKQRPQLQPTLLKSSTFMDLDELAVQLNINNDIPQDCAAFAILRPLFSMPLPSPWQFLRQENKRYVFYHPGVRETRIKHPLFSFFVEVLEFLRCHATTRIRITEPLAAQVFKEASPGELRRRLGVWQGPLLDSTRPSGERFSRLVKGEDDVCIEADMRPDDPRVEAADNVMARLAAWRHLWMGFAKDEVFPYAVDRLRALSTQLAESVVVVPGAAAEHLLDQMTGKVKLELPKILTEEEEAVQSGVCDALGFAYGRALESMQGGEVSPKNSRGPFSPTSQASGYLDAFEEEETYEEEVEQASSHPEEEEPCTPEEEPGTPEESEATESEEEIEPFVCEIPPVVVPEPQEPARPKTPEPVVIRPFLSLDMQTADDWAASVLRPRTPTGETPRPKEPADTHRHTFQGNTLMRFGAEDRIWEDDLRVRTTVVRPWVRELGWKVAKSIGELQWDAIQATSPRVPPLEADSLKKPPDRIEAALKTLLVDGELPFHVTSGIQARHAAKAAEEVERQRLAAEARAAAEAAEAAAEAERLRDRGKRGQRLAREAAKRKELEGDQATDEAEEEKETYVQLEYLADVGLPEGSADPAQAGSDAHEPMSPMSSAANMGADGADGAEGIEGAEGEEKEEDGEDAPELDPEAAAAAAAAAAEAEARARAAAEAAERERRLRDAPSLPGSPCAMRGNVTAVHQRADDMSRMLDTSEEYFDRTVFDKTFKSQWRSSHNVTMSTHGRDTRSNLKKASAIVSLAGPGGDTGSGDCVPVRGQVACPPSPAKGDLPLPPHLLNAKTPAQPALTSQRPSSAGPKQYVEPPVTAMPPSFYNRPSSARARARPMREGRRTLAQMTSSERAAAEITTASIKRFLSRTFGTMEAAISKLDPTGRGRVTREAFVDGLKKLGFETMGDIEEAFIFLDKRCHYMLTLADFQDSREGQKPRQPNLLGVANEVLFDSIDDALRDIVCEVLRDSLEEALLSPSGPYGKSRETTDQLHKIRMDMTARRSSVSGSRSRGSVSPSGLSKGRTPSPFGSGAENVETTENEEDNSPQRSKFGKTKGKNKPKKGVSKTILAMSKMKMGMGAKPGPGSRPSSREQTTSPSRPTSRQNSRLTPKKSPSGTRQKSKGFKAAGTAAALGARRSRPTSREQSSPSRPSSRPSSKQSPSKKSPSGTRQKSKGSRGAGAAAAAGTRRRPDSKDTSRSRSPNWSDKSSSRPTSRQSLGRQLSRGSHHGGRSPSTRPFKEDVIPEHGHGGKKKGGSKKKTLSRGRSQGAGGKAAGRTHGGSATVGGGSATVGGGAFRRSSTETTYVDEDVSEEEMSDEEAVVKRKKRQQAAARRAQRAAAVVPPARKFNVGYNFAEAEVSLENQLPWCPRPAEEICKTYGHIFRLLKDPRVRKPAERAPKRGSLSVSVSVPQLRKASFGDIEEEDDFATSDRAMPLPTAALTKGSKGWHAKSSPSLMTKLSAVSTTAGSGWNPYTTESDLGSDASPLRSSAGAGLELPPLATAKPSSAPLKRHHSQPGRGSGGIMGGPGRAAAGIDAGARLRIPQAAR